ncbi:MAG TPA: neutral zinc metallopeptidase [Pyrinomonadaceae bacterium]|nr:zinc metallopeptidase [Chloracidobacterium sp.]MBP9935095.1 zinc metallopeptidase [Pyrinomonadaceae bacterium]HQY66652.1 neutral zinc metallopeptidase [Pyrinomonadaceae bacterium]
MRWRDQRQSTNIEDRRGMGGRTVALGGGSLGVLVLAIAIYLCGGDPSQLLQNAPNQGGVADPGVAANKPVGQDDNRQFVGAIMGSLEDAWKQILPQQARVRYQDPKLVLFTGQVSSACGYASAATGPFYCPGDYKLYLDFAFFDELRREFKAPGDFAQAYVIAHEFGHHIQNLTGTMDKVQQAGNNNRLSVALELQADCYAGIWANYAAKQNRLETGDIEEAIRAAQAVGDDMIQKRTQGYVVPDSFTHGSAAQRAQYFAIGIKSGDLRQCSTIR